MVNEQGDEETVRAVMFAEAHRKVGVRQRPVEAVLRCLGGGVVEPMTRDTLAACVTSDRVLLANPQTGTSAPPQRAIRPVKIFSPRPTDVLSELVTEHLSQS